jgi:HAD superfamily hydrolase (TIGR01509 family)
MKPHHIGIETENLFTLERFYCGWLGFRRVYRYVSKNSPGLRTVFLQRDGFCIELLERPRDPLSRARCRQWRHHLAFEVQDPDAEYRRLSAQGLPCKPPRTTGDGWRELTLEDPEGNIVELCCKAGTQPRPWIRAVIFDFDGTLVDSEENYYLADAQMMSKFGIRFTRQDKAQYVGRGTLDQLTDLKRRHGLKQSVEELYELKNQLYLELALCHTTVFSPMMEFLKGVKNRGLPTAVASGSAPHVLSALLERLELRPFFDAVVSAEQTEHKRGKPAPDVFLEAAKCLLTEPAHCLVLEDTAPGVESACRAWMHCIAVPSFPLIADSHADFAMADVLVAGGMEDFDPGTMLSWLDERREGG